MGNKTNPIGMRLQVNRTWDSRWYADTKDYGDLLLEDIAIREFIEKDIAHVGIEMLAGMDEHLGRARTMLTQRTRDHGGFDELWTGAYDGGDFHDCGVWRKDACRSRFIWHRSTVVENSAQCSGRAPESGV